MASRLESSKAFAKVFMERYGIPTADYGTFTDSMSAVNSIKNQKGNVVVKASGLAAGKGVLIPESKTVLEDILISYSVR